MKSGIYKITNPKGKIYIGCTNNLEKRIKNYQNGKITTQPLMFESWSKYGWDSHTTNAGKHLLLLSKEAQPLFFQGVLS